MPSNVEDICDDGMRAEGAAALLEMAGFEDARPLAGGLAAWEAEESLPALLVEEGIGELLALRPDLSQEAHEEEEEADERSPYAVAGIQADPIVVCG